jgi:cytoskeletal protein CcmA (bactofilin family)|tara:strand:+ start:18483 stop:19445 length:963 start_codon:yes stop_codon:yes gene_type:complete
MATYVNDLRLKEIATGDESGTWGTSTNTNLELIGEAFSFGTEAITTNADTHTTTIADGSTDPGRSLYLKYTGTLDSACTITIAPNTVSKLWFIENGTTGSQNIIISQGSGANITIPAGDTKLIYSDGAGSGAAMVDAFASLNVVDLKVEDDLTVTDDVAIGGLATVGGTLGVTGIVTLTDDLIIGDGKTIGSASDVDAMTIASNGQITLTQTLIGTALDISGDIDVDGTTNLDVVDIDGAVDMATTLTVGGEITAASLDISGDVDIDGTLETDALSIASTTITSTAAELNFSDGVTSNIQTQLNTKTSTGKAIAMAVVFG